MKRNLQVICLLISVFGCNVSHNKPTLYHTKVLIGPEFEQFDTTIMYVSSKHERETGKQYLKSKQADTVFQKNNYNETLRIYDSKGRLVKDIIVFFNAKIYSEEFMDDSSRISKEFYSNGYIKNKAVFHWLGFKIGFDYKFNEKGKLTDAIDNDKGYVYNIDHLQPFFKKYHIIFPKNSSLQNITKTNRQGKKVWIIQAFDEKGGLFIYTVDAKTGKLLSTSPIKYIP